MTTHHDIRLPDELLAHVRWYGELVEVVLARVRGRVAARLQVESQPLLRARITTRGGNVLERVLPFTPYAAEMLVDDARHAGPEGRVELMLPAGVSEGAVAAVRARLGTRGVTVDVRCRPCADPDA